MRALDVGERIHSIRKHLGLTQDRFAQRLGVTKVSVARYEAGRVPRLRGLREIARLGGVTVTWLLDGSSPQIQQSQLQPGPLEKEFVEAGRDLLTFLQRKASVVTTLPTQYRKRYEERIRELVARAKRELDEYQKVLEAESRSRGKKS